MKSHHRSIRNQRSSQNHPVSNKNLNQRIRSSMRIETTAIFVKMVVICYVVTTVPALST
jgi:hypothetical protein